jgi:malonyl CoA-acyl carrier protein transacylase
MTESTAIAIVGLGAILPDALDVPTFWKNIQAGRYSISEVPANRWRADLFYDPNPAAPDKTYSKLGGWVKGFQFDAKGMGIAIPPRVLAQIDEAQQWAISASFQALQDYGYPERYLDPDRLAVILGSALGGEHHYKTTIRIHLPEYLDILASLPDFQNLDGDVQASLLQGLSRGLQSSTPAVTEDTMPGELSNIIAGRVANVFNFSGPNFVTDAACASSLAALQSAMEGLASHKFDAVLTGGVDRNMGVEAYVKFCKIGALSPDGSRPYAEGANGFVMGEGAAIFLLKRLEDAERDGDKVYAVVRGIGGSSDGKGKGITAPNPVGQQRAIERAWKNAGLPPTSTGLIEGHGTSTPVGDLVEVNSLGSVFGNLGIKPGSVALGSVKSNFGHLKSAAGAAGLLKTVLALHDHLLPPSANFEQPSSKIDFNRLPFQVNRESRPWDIRQGDVRRAGVSAFGFGGTNFHVVMEEYLPGMLTRTSTVHPGVSLASVSQPVPAGTSAPESIPAITPYRGLFFVSADTIPGLRQVLVEKISDFKQGHPPASSHPTPAQLGKAERLVIDYGNPEELVKAAEAALGALDSESPLAWQPLSMRGIQRGSGKPGKVGFLFPGQGSQYVNMLRGLHAIEPVVAETFREADEVMTPILGRSITSYIFVDGDEKTLAQAELSLRDTTIAQPAMLTVNVALLRLLAKFGYQPEIVLGHSLGEYAALVASGALTLPEALKSVSARGKEMARVASDDNGCMAAVSAPLGEVERILKTIDGYVVIANINSPLQCVIGGMTAAVEAAITACLAAGYQATKIPVSHAFHTRIVAPASQPLRRVIASMNLQAPKIPVVANVTGKLYPVEREEMLDMLAAQVASPVQFVQGVKSMYEAGTRIFIEVGPKRVLSGLAADILKDKTDVISLSTNHPRKGDLASFHEALCRLYAAGVNGIEAETTPAVTPTAVDISTRGLAPILTEQNLNGRLPLTGSVVISGVGLGLPGRGKHVFDDNNIFSILNGEMRIDPLPEETRRSMLEKRPNRLVKSEAGAVMQTIDDINQTIKLAGQRGEFDPVDEFGFPIERYESTDISTQLAIAAGIEALRDAGIPLVMAYKRTSTGGYLPDRWKLPEALADETGVIFGSAFPGLDQMAAETDRFHQSQMVECQLEELRRMADLVPSSQTDLREAFARRIAELEAENKRLDYHFDRRFVFRVLSMGHSQFAEYIGARGPNTQVNAACSTTTNAIAIAEDWIRLGRARRVIIIAGDDVISGSLPEWIGTSLMVSGAATTEGDLRLAALPFDRRRNGMLIGMGAAGLVIESEDAVRERGMRAICELLASHISNSAYHGTRLDVKHVSKIMEALLRTAEERYGISRNQIAAETVFVSHETYTPARGGSASAEIHALRQAFGDNANQVVIANTKGFTGHTMAVGIEDVVAVKALEYGIVPPIANIQNGFEPDPELGDLNLSRGGKYPIQYSLRLGAGFGSQLAMTLLRKISGQGERVNQPAYRKWLSEISGYPDANVEIEKRTLRIPDQGVPINARLQSRWQYGQGPTMWADASEPDSTPTVPAAHPVEEPAAPQPSTPMAVVGEDDIKAYVLSAISEKTGYPVEVLEPDLDLEADLGIDTVKQAELFADLRTHYSIPRREDLRLSDYNTLAKVIGFVRDSIGNISQPAAQAEAVPANEPVEIAQPETAPVLSDADHEQIKTHVLTAVSGKTGYPVEVLDLDLDLEADLGIDTVKQAELFADLRTQYNIPRREDLRLSDYNTLAKVIGFVEDALRTKEETSPSSAPNLEDKAAQPEVNPEPEAVKITRRIPMPTLRPRLDLCIPSGVELGKGSRVLVVEGRTKNGRTLIRKLTERKVDVLRLEAGTASDQVNEKVKAWLEEGPIQGVYFLAGLEIEPSLAEMTTRDWQTALEMRLYRLATIMRLMPEETFLVCATRMGGLHGYSAEGASAPMGGAISGFAKALARERVNAVIKVVDFEADASMENISTHLVDETLQNPGAVEIGWEGDLRFGIAAIEQALPTEKDFSLKEGSVFVVSGGTGDIIRPILTDLAQVTRGTFYLLNRNTLPDPGNPELARLVSDRAELQKDMHARFAADGKKATPLEVEKAMLALERSAATLKMIQTIEQMGGKVHSLACNVTDPEAVDTAIRRIKEAEGHVDVFLHAAGIESSRNLAKKSPEEFRQVFSVKADGFFNLFKAMEKRELLPRGMVLFSSVAGRFGNSGQTDYSAANDLLCKLTSALRKQHPEIKTVIIDWGPWSQTGMAARGNIPTLMEMAGIDMLPPGQAAPMLRNELMAGSGECIIAGSLGALLKTRHPDGELDLARADDALRDGKPIHTMLSHITGFDPESGLVLEADLDPQTQPFLRDHAMNGTPILPGVMGIEGFSIAARHIGSVLAGGRNKGLDVRRLEDIHFLSPFKFHKNKARRITWTARAVRENSGLVVYVTLESTRTQLGHTDERILHFTGKVFLEPKESPMREVKIEPPDWNGRYTVKADEIYRLYFHGPAFQVLEAVQRSGDTLLGKLQKSLPSITNQEHDMLSTPTLVELCFQTAGIWEMGKTGTMALPRSIESLTLHRQHVNGHAVYAEVTPGQTENGELHFDARVVDARGHLYLELKNYRTIAIPDSVESALLTPFEELVRNA